MKSNMISNMISNRKSNMKGNRKSWSKLVAAGCGMVLVLNTICGCGTENASSEDVLTAQNAQQEQTDEYGEIKNLQDTMDGFAESKLIRHSASAGKEETVYVMMDADGLPTDTVVSEWLKNPEGSQVLADASSLQDIKVVKGTAEFTQETDHQVTWKTDGSDVYYQGKSQEELPLTVTVSYALDGKTVTAKELEGATGHLTICFDYVNNTATTRMIAGEERTIYQPFLVASGLIFDNEKASNVEIDNGKVINSGDLTMAFGIAMPGLEESLGLNELEDENGEKLDIAIPRQVVVDADVTDFSLLMTVSVASNNALSELGLDDFESMDDLKEKIADLTGGMDDIIDGATRLNNGVADLSDGTGKLVDGSDDLSAGAYNLADGAEKLLNGTFKIGGGADQLQKGTKQVNQGANALKGGIDQLKAKTPELQSGVEQLAEGADALYEGLNAITANNDTLRNGAANLEGGVSALYGSLSSEESKTKLATLLAGSGAVKDGLNQTGEGLNNMVAGYNPEGEALSQTIAYLENYAASLNASGDAASQQSAMAIMGVVTAYRQLYGNVAAVSAGVNQLNDAQAGYPAVYEGMAQLLGEGGTMQQLENSSKQLLAGATQLKNGVQSYTAGVDSVKGGAESLNGGLASLSGQLPALVNGITELSAGADSLSKGTGELEKGAKTLSDGTDDLSEGALELTEGAKKLSGGARDLKDGVRTLSDGVAELFEGSGELRDGVIRFNDEGIQKLAKIVNEDMDKYYERLCAVRDYAGEYQSFSGVKDGTECSVQFIYKTEGIGK